MKGISNTRGISNGKLEHIFWGTVNGEKINGLHCYTTYRDERLKAVTNEYAVSSIKHSFDPRIKLVIALFCCATSVFVSTPLVTAMFVAGMLINLYERNIKSSLCYGAVYAVLLLSTVSFIEP